MPLASIELSPRIGSAIETDAATLLAGTHAAEIRSLLELRGVLLFREIGLTDEEQAGFARTLGPVQQELYKVSFDPKENPEFAAYTLGTYSWHIDRIDLDVPPLGSILSPRILSTTGGETEFANTSAAYQDLPEDYKAWLDTLKVIHTIESSYREVPNPSEDLLAFARKFEPKTQPLVWKHRSGRKSLTLGVHASQVVGMTKPESDGLISELLSWATQPQYVYRHRWKMGDMVMWDNTGTMHRVLPFDQSCGRTLHRTTLSGEEAVAAP